MLRLIISTALLGTSAIQYLLLALSITPVGVCPVSVLLKSSFLPLLSVGIKFIPPMSASDVAVLEA